MKLKLKKGSNEQMASQNLASGRVLSLDAPQSRATQGLSLIPVKAFSLAETMIVILIGTIALGMSAPMISRQLRSETLNSAQFQVINRKIESL